MLEVMWKLVIKQPTIQYHSHFPLPPIQSQLQSSHCGAVTELESPHPPSKSAKQQRSTSSGKTPTWDPNSRTALDS
jgi:hypothetical protein